MNVQKIKELALALKEELSGTDLYVDVRAESHPRIVNHGPKTYAAAVDWMREVGVKTRTKSVYDTYTALSGVSIDGFECATYPDELPPTCRKVTYVEKVPKQQTVDTGEFVEITKTRVVCGKEEDDNQQPNFTETTTA